MIDKIRKRFRVMDKIRLYKFKTKPECLLNPLKFYEKRFHDFVKKIYNMLGNEEALKPII